MTGPGPLPTFSSRRLVIRPRTLDDTDACLAMDREPEVTRFVVGPWTDPVAHRLFIESRTIGPYPAGLGYWTIVPCHMPATFVGWMLLIPTNGSGPEVEIGWRLRQSMWGMGYATEAARPVVDHAFRALGLDEVVAEIDPLQYRLVAGGAKAGSDQTLREPGSRQHGMAPHHSAHRS